MPAYRLFDTSVSSQLPLPELPGSEGREPVIRIVLGDAGSGDVLDFETRHEWRDKAGRLLCRCARRDADYLLSVPLQADFHITADGTITCLAKAGTVPASLRQLLLNQVLPRYLAHTGELLLHASAVTLPNGSAVAFVGSSGMGKSTLASYCVLHGAQLIDDDCILVRSAQRCASIYGGVPTIRLYPDSLHALGHQTGAFEPCINNPGKLQMCLADSATFTAQPRVLDALFILGAACEAPARDTVRIAAAPGPAAMMSLLGNAFSLDPSDRDTMRRSFLRAAQVLAGGLPVYHLNFPRQHALLPQVLQALLERS